MIILDYKKNHHNSIIQSCVHALKKGKIVVYPTDTSYGLAVDATNVKAIKKLYKIKGRDFNKPVHVIVPSLTYARNIVQWNSVASKLAKKFFPGPLTLVLPLSTKHLALRTFSAKTGFLGVRMPNNKIALDLSKSLKRPITATSANKSGKPDCYSAGEVLKQFKALKYQPDILINAGKLARRKPSTLVKINKNRIEILRQGPVSEKQINKLLLNTKSTKILNL